MAVAAGVAKTTVYRRYPNTVDLVLATINHLNTDEPAPDTGSAHGDLVALLELVRQRFDLSITGTLLAEERERPELLEAARRQMIVPAIDRFRHALLAGIERGEVRSGLAVDVAAHALLGAFFMRYLELGRPGSGWAQEVVGALWPAFAAPGAPA